MAVPGPEEIPHRRGKHCCSRRVQQGPQHRLFLNFTSLPANHVEETVAKDRVNEDRVGGCASFMPEGGVGRNELFIVDWLHCSHGAVTVPF